MLQRVTIVQRRCCNNSSCINSASSLLLPFSGSTSHVATSSHLVTVTKLNHNFRPRLLHLAHSLTNNTNKTILQRCKNLFFSPSLDHMTMAGRDANGLGRVAIVTGPTGTGIGFETSRWLAESGYHVILAGRSQERLDKCRNDIVKAIEAKSNHRDAINSSPPIQLTPLVCDLSSLASIESFVTEFEKLNLPLHILINNAGVLASSYTQTVNGFESTFGTNHVGHFYLTNLLLPKLRQNAPSRIVNVSSEGHQISPKLTNENMRELAFHPPPAQYKSWHAYGLSKLANMLHAKELNRRYAANGVTAYSLHPGSVATSIAKDGFAQWYWKWFGWTMKTPEIGAGTTIYCATSPEALKNAGSYFETCTVSKKVSSQANDTNLAELMWTMTEEEIQLWKKKRKIPSRL